ncbi:nicotinamide-nucleotide amidase [Alkalithermobacter thermoalcaliphilus JW-YL-7 = DSM 7308]|uniref:CinA domain protein n=1 Tax=Alkalithermobacter thermoalcaliphilus JW-YL-7 = DSM 7308 TaxID=1121328 RepID=A0A150FQQ4_CLOPD|nr:CinA domain protein [[Clostridium] paradoxum JW-YL-7 = DSM 7308]SHL25595.1 nicotinamide-nucleotide amidase [[Clostridium] paradoxum JW-YL-7 = DSM 7308]
MCVKEVIENEVVKILKSKNLTISVAESCTGGIISSKLINCSGVSSVFIEGIVAYSNQSKIDRLNVNKDTLDKYGAVSEETAKEMAFGIAKSTNVDIAISTTGIAGPLGGSDIKPVGLVYIGLYIKGNIKVKKINLKGERNYIRNEASTIALRYLKEELEEYINQ